MRLNMKARKSLAATYVKIIIVIVIIAVAGYFAYRFLNKSYNEEEFETIKTDMLLIQGKTEIVGQKVGIKEKGAEYIGTKIEEKKEEPVIQNLIQKEIIDIDSKDSTYYCLDNDDLKELELDKVTTNNYFIVDYKKNDVIYVDGIENKDGNTIYKLSEMK